MQVIKYETAKIKILLSDTEVMCCFGSYENLSTMDAKIKSYLNALIRDIIYENSNLFNKKKAKVRIKIARENGCEILIFPIGSIENMKEQETVFEFSNSENLTLAILHLYKSKAYTLYKSSLYKVSGGYRLIVKNKNGKTHHLQINEFYRFKSEDFLVVAETKEYGKQLIKDSAIEQYGKAFAKRI